ncbi:hypothetical protein LGQ02_11730 [Bacillus shivajii]|uniref:hypothetical protein n=1 Tax=Bacillus shivajii TaxID=1983719 RepID=UPI001CF99312|nr:hypothetical protein [Bacillus shivajii]UCZ51542.1 hypothetical protein LGQ02_11730 [Bacillus shivajii]
MINKLYMLSSLTFLILIIGCSNNDDLIKQATEELDYDVLLPSYIPSKLELVEVTLEDDRLFLNYQDTEETTFIEFSQRQFARGIDTERFLEFTETGEDPYEKFPKLSYREIGNYVGEYEDREKIHRLSFMFIPSVPRSQIDNYPFYHIRAVGIDEEDFHKVVRSLN